MASILAHAGRPSELVAGRLQEAAAKSEAGTSAAGGRRRVRRYTVVLAPDPDAGGYTVSVPALPGCVTEGDTLEEALTNAKDAIQVYLEDLEASGEPIPEERERPELALVEV
jgi:predicted RNase H-like HicB family nuclease